VAFQVQVRGSPFLNPFIFVDWAVANGASAALGGYLNTFLNLIWGKFQRHPEPSPVGLGFLLQKLDLTLGLLFGKK